MNHNTLRDVVVEINLDCIAHNVRTIKEIIGNDVAIKYDLEDDM